MNTSQKRAIKNYRRRLSQRGMARFEVLGLDADRDLIRSFARRLAEGGPGAARLRTAVSQTIAGQSPRKGGILEALRRSPLVGADLDPRRRFEEGARSRCDGLDAAESFRSGEVSLGGLQALSRSSLLAPRNPCAST